MKGFTMWRSVGVWMVTAAALAACGATPAPVVVDRAGLPAPAARADWTPPAVETWQLPNGLSVWLVTQRQAPLVALELVLSRGAATDPVGKAGLTDLMVDLLDEGAGDRTALELADAMQRLATDYGAGTATDGVTLSMDLLADKLDASLGLFADILLRPALSVDEFERRKAQRLAQALAAEANPGTARTVVVRKALYGDGYGGWPANGVRHTIEALTHGDVKAQYAAVVKPQGATLVVVGAVDRATLEPLLKRHLGEWQGAPTAQPMAVEAKAPERAIYLVDYPGATQSAIAVARRIPGHDAAGDAVFAGQVFNWALGGAFTSRLNLNLREDKGYTYGARAGLHRWRAAGMYLLGAAVKADTTAASFKETFKELAGMYGERPLTEEERAQAQGGMLLSFPGRFEQLASVAGQYASMRLDGHDPAWFRAWPAKLGAVTLAQARAEAKALTNPDDFLLVVAGDAAALTPALAAFNLPIKRFDAQGRPVAAPADGTPADGAAPAEGAPAQTPGQ